jgi:hypothetical protein
LFSKASRATRKLLWGLARKFVQSIEELRGSIA